jgi:photosystem II stability/assembly factor-like uncharacterized protein
MDARRCIDAIDDNRFVAVSEAGECRMYPSRGVQTGVTVWGLARNVVRGRQLATRRSA